MITGSAKVTSAKKNFFNFRSLDFLTKVFELFAEYDFVVITVPHLVPEFPLLQSFVVRTFHSV